MTTAININKYIRQFISDSKELLDIVTLDNIKPMILPPRKFPFIAYTHGDINVTYTKDGRAEDEVDVLFACVSDDYEQSIKIAEILRDLLESKCYNDDDIYISCITVKSISEDYIDNAFVLMLTFNFKIDIKN